MNVFECVDTDQDSMGAALVAQAMEVMVAMEVIPIFEFSESCEIIWKTIGSNSLFIYHNDDKIGAIVVCTLTRSEYKMCEVWSLACKQ